MPAFAYCLISSFSSPAVAEDSSAYLDEVVVTATKIEESRKDVPASVQVITQEDIKNSTALNAGDLIAEAGLGHVHKYTGALTSRIGLRGLTTDLLNDLNSRVLILVNSHRAGTVNLAKIPAEDIERIEIVKGPGSVLYGSSAMGGVINIITKKKGEGEGLHGSLSAEAGSWGFWKAGADLGLSQGPFDLFLSAGRSSIDDFEAKGVGTVENSGYKNASLTAGFGVSLPADQKLSLGFQYWKGWEIADPGPRYAADPDNFSDKEKSGFDVGYERGTFSAGYYFISDRDEAHGGMIKGLGNSDITTKKTLTQGASLQKTVSIGEQRIIIGGQWDRVEARSWKSTGSPSIPDSQYDTYAAFAEGRLSLFDSRLLLSGGIRYDWFENSILATEGIAVNQREESLDHLTVRGGVVYKVTDTLRLKGNIGSAFRAPAPNELSADYSTSIRYLGNPNLKPEKSTTFDAGVEYAEPLLRAGLTFFHTELDNKILSSYDSSLAAMTWKNVDGATLQGIELNASYDLGLALGLNVSLEPFTNITYLTRFSSRDEQEIGKYGKTLLYTPKWTGVFGIKAGQERWDARLIANYTGDERVQDWSASPYPVVEKGDFTVVSLKGAYRPIKSLEITASVENLFDRAYAYILGYPMQGRTATAGLKWKF
ncbi:MAG: TonB-dependent receptor [Nitrospirales bacterium]|nr:TonB-dependent receptor [Nitrospirales bacterium]